MIESRCGIKCSECECKEKMNCAGCINIEKPFWDNSCTVKSCYEDKDVANCGICNSFPCHIYKNFLMIRNKGMMVIE